MIILTIEIPEEKAYRIVKFETLANKYNLTAYFKQTGEDNGN